jgi:hypothetical protein
MVCMKCGMVRHRFVGGHHRPCLQRKSPARDGAVKTGRKQTSMWTSGAYLGPAASVYAARLIPDAPVARRSGFFWNFGWAVGLHRALKLCAWLVLSQTAGLAWLAGVAKRPLGPLTGECMPQGDTA